MSLKIIALFIAAYLIGAIPFSVWVGKIFFGKDIRKEGSGNAGATNTFRVLGPVAGIIVLLLDMAKGSAAVLLANSIQSDSTSQIYYQIGLGLMAAFGHIFPIYLGFKGGKGVATLFGVVLMIFPMSALFAVASFVIIFAITRYVSLGSMIASLVFMSSIFVLDDRRGEWPVILFAVAAPLIIFYTHRKNIQRLISGTENKISFSKKTISK